VDRLADHAPTSEIITNAKQAVTRIARVVDERKTPLFVPPKTPLISEVDNSAP
jgi:hypothetical protein